MRALFLVSTIYSGHLSSTVERGLRSLISFLIKAVISSQGLHLHDLITIMMGFGWQHMNVETTQTPSPWHWSFIPLLPHPSLDFTISIRSVATSFGQQLSLDSPSPFWWYHFLHNMLTMFNLPFCLRGLLEKTQWDQEIREEESHSLAKVVLISQMFVK